MGNNGDNAKGFEFKKFATPRIIGGIAIVVIVLWALTIIFGSPGGPPPASSPDRPSPQSSAAHQSDSVAPSAHSETVDQSEKSLVKSPFTPVDFDKRHTTAAADATEHTASADHETTPPDSSAPGGHDTASQKTAAIHPSDARPNRRSWKINPDGKRSARPAPNSCLRPRRTDQRSWCRQPRGNQRQHRHRTSPAGNRYRRSRPQTHAQRGCLR